MAEENEIIISIQLDQEGALDEMQKVRKSIMDLQAEKKNLNEAYKEGKITQEQYIEQTIELEGQLKKAQGAYRDLNKEQDTNSNSINALRLSNKRLLDERNNLDLQTEKGKARLQEINEQLDKNNAAIKANVSAYEKQKIGIGDYTGALAKFFPFLEPLQSGFEGIKGAMDKGAEGAEGANKSMWKLVMNPIGAIIAAVVGLLALLYKGLTSTSGGADMLEDVMASLSAVFQVIMDRVGKLAMALVSLFTGDLQGAAEGFSGAVSGMGDEMAHAAKEARELAAATRDLEDATIAFEVASVETENQIKRLMLQAKNRNLTEEERIKLLNQATDLEKGRVAQEVANAEAALNIASRQAALKFNVTKKANETEIEFGKRVLEAAKADNAAQADDLRDKVKEMLIARQEAEGKSLAFQEKIQNQRDALLEKAAQEEEKREAERQKQRDKWIEWNNKQKEAASSLLILQKERAAEEAKTEQEKFRLLTEAENEKLRQTLTNTKLTENEKLLARAQTAAAIRDLEKEMEDAIKSRQEKEAEDAIKREKVESDLMILRLQNRAKDTKDEEERFALLVEIESEKMRMLLMNEKLTTDEITLIREQSARTIVELERAKNEKIRKDNEETAAKEKAEALAVKSVKLQTASQVFQGIQGIVKQGTIASKAAALADIGVNTALGFIQALDIAQKSAKGTGPLAALSFPIFYASQIASVLGAAAKAKQVLGFAEGGLSGTRVNESHGIPITRSNGDNILATIRTGEVILNERQQAALGGANTFRRIGVPGFASGGIAGMETIDAARLNRTNVQIDELLKSVSEQRPVLVLEEFEFVSSRKSSADKNAVIV